MNYLNSFLDDEQIEIVYTLWIVGLVVDESITLPDEYVIHSIQDMPESREKDYFQKRRVTNGVVLMGLMSESLVPLCAITKSYKVSKFYDDVRSAPAFSYWDVEYNLREIALLLNAINDIFCVPYHFTFSPAATTPFGIFGGGGGGTMLYDVVCSNFTKLNRQSIASFKTLIDAYLKKSKSEKMRLQSILNRLSQAKRRSQIADKILDLGITLEMLLLDDEPKQLALSFSLRGSWLIGNSPEDRLKIYEQLKDIYSYRCQVAHTGVLKGDSRKIERIKEAFPEYLSLAEKILQKIIEAGTPKWDKLLLGAID